MKVRLITFIITLISMASVFALDLENFSTSLDYAQVTEVSAGQKANGSWCFNVEVRHNDQGWAHYADGWQVIDLEGNQLGFRLLAHPHDNEQPFVRGQCNIQIPSTLSKVAVRAKCNQHGYGGKPVMVELK